jgi:D-psicose/D-tagatose/L-ribulose 3-epimerase
MRLSISNLAWPEASVAAVAPRLSDAGLSGLEVAPTAVWPDAPRVPAREVKEYARQWQDYGFSISGIQSLMFGHPQFQLFDRDTWPEMLEHLTAVIRLGEALGTHVAVFGSPKNRVKGNLTDHESNLICTEFLHLLIPVLMDCGIVFMLEPNAPAYGADYLTHYIDTVVVADLVASPWVQPQVDTGCLSMVGADSATAIRARTPAHVHISSPNLAAPPGPVDHTAVRQALIDASYEGWVVLEMLKSGSNPFDTAVQSATWLAATYGSEST